MASGSHTDLANKVLPIGSVFVNNTSYSGCDIKVLVTIYDGGKSYAEYIKSLEEQLEQTQSSLDAVRGQISGTSTKLSASKDGTTERNKYSVASANLKAQEHNLQNMLTSLSARLTENSKNKPQVSTRTLATCQTLSVSTFRDKQEVRAFGSVYAKGVTRGQRTIAGSMIFTVFNEHVLYEFLEAHGSDFDANRYTSAMLDQLPPVSIQIAFANEYGQISRMELHGVDFVSEGMPLSIEDLLIENSVQFIARDMDPMRSVAARKIDQTSHILQSEFLPKRASDLLLEEDVQAINDKLNPFNRTTAGERFRRRRNPYL